MEHEHLHTYLLGFEIKADNNEAFKKIVTCNVYEQRKQSFIKFILLQNTSFAPVINVRPKVSLKSRKAA